MNATLSERTFRFKGRSPLRNYISGILFGILCLFFLFTGPLVAKVVFGYLLLGNVLTLTPWSAGHARLGSDQLHIQIKLLWLIKIPYHDIEAVSQLPSGGIRAKILGALRGSEVGYSHLKIALRRPRWVFLPFPFPVIFSTRSLFLTVADGQLFAEELSHRI